MEMDSVLTADFSMGAAEGELVFFRFAFGAWDKAPFKTSLTWENWHKGDVILNDGVHFLQVFFIFFRDKNGFYTVTISGHGFFLQSANGQDTAAERDFTSHGYIFANRDAA